MKFEPASLMETRADGTVEWKIYWPNPTTVHASGIALSRKAALDEMADIMLQIRKAK